MTTTPAEQRGAAELAASLRRRLEGAPTVRHAAYELLQFVVVRLGISQVLVVFRQGERIDGLQSGLPPELLDETLRVAREEQASSLALGPGDEGPVLRDRRLLPAEIRSFRRLNIENAGPRLAASVWLPDGAHPEALQAAGDILARTTPLLARLSETEALRRESEEWRQQVHHLRKAFDHLPDPVLVMDQTNQLVLTNPRADELLVAEPEDSAGRRGAVETNNLYFSAFRAMVVLGDAQNRELLLVDPADGSDLLFEVSAVEISSPGGPDEGYIYILRDITDLKRATGELEAEYRRAIAAEHRARRESERLNVILANAGVPILVTDERSDIVLMNLEAEALFEASDEEGTASRSVRVIRSNDAKLSGLISDFLLQGLARREDEVQLHEPLSDREFPAQVTLTKLFNRRDEPVGVVCALHDLSEEREIQRLADQLRRLNRELEARVEEATAELSKRNKELEVQREELVRASRMKSEFLAMMSHELRTPINSILGFNSLLREGIFGDLSSEQSTALDKVHAASSHLLSLINDILDLSKVEAGKLSLSVDSVPVGPFLETLSETVRPMAETRGLEFRLEPPPHVRVLADPMRLRQVLLNLASNAVKFTPAGTVTIRVVPGGESGRMCIEVEDTGVGIAEEDLDRIFEEFSQGGQFPTREHGGTGLGLAISRKLVALMEGTLSVRSAPGKGSTFRVHLPLDGLGGEKAKRIATP